MTDNERDVLVEVLHAVGDKIEGSHGADAVLDALHANGYRIVPAAHDERVAAEAVAAYVKEHGLEGPHVVTFTEDGYGLQHPVTCRHDLIGCIYNEWLATQLGPDRDPGKYAMTWTDDGPNYALLNSATNAEEAG